MAVARLLPNHFLLCSSICSHRASKLVRREFKSLMLHSMAFSSSNTISRYSTAPANSPSPSSECSLFSGTEDVMMGYVFGKKKATEVVHSSWNHVLRKGDVAIDATCGNGYDTIALVKMVAGDMSGGRVYGMDIQKVAIESTSHLLDQSVTQAEKACVDLFLLCHSKMEEVVPSGVAVRLVAFNLGYLPGGRKTILTRPETTLPALEAAEKILAPGGLITVVVYIGHQGGREELDTVQTFASKLSVENWTCCKLETINRPFAPVIIFLHRRHQLDASQCVSVGAPVFLRFDFLEVECAHSISRKSNLPIKVSTIRGLNLTVVPIKQAQWGASSRCHD